MSGLLGNALPALYGASNKLKKNVKGLLSDPTAFMESAVQGVLTDAMNARGLLSAAADESAANIKAGRGMEYGPANQRAATALADAYSPVGMTRMELQPVNRIADLLRSQQALDPKSMPLADFARAIKLRNEARNKLASELEQSAEGLMAPVRGGGFWGITKEARPDGLGWRVTQFDAEMAPVGHQVYESPRNALLDLMKAGDASRF